MGAGDYSARIVIVKVSMTIFLAHDGPQVKPFI